MVLEGLAKDFQGGDNNRNLHLRATVSGHLPDQVIEVGHQDVKCFSRTFKERFGKLPFKILND